MILCSLTVLTVDQDGFSDVERLSFAVNRRLAARRATQGDDALNPERPPAFAADELDLDAGLPRVGCRAAEGSGKPPGGLRPVLQPLVVVARPLVQLPEQFGRRTLPGPFADEPQQVAGDGAGLQRGLVRPAAVAAVG